jgi:poly(A) polymerase
VAWALLVARICQLYPNAIAGAIVSRFFIIMYQWLVAFTYMRNIVIHRVPKVMASACTTKTNRRRAITSQGLESKGEYHLNSSPTSFLHLPQLYPADRAHRMPIITPAYPAMCSTHNVTASTQMIITEEFKRGN